jgi:hypothetical protein
MLVTLHVPILLIYRRGRERARRLLAASSLHNIFDVLVRLLLLRRTVGIEIRRTGYTSNALRMWHSFLLMPACESTQMTGMLQVPESFRDSPINGRGVDAGQKAEGRSGRVFCLLPSALCLLNSIHQRLSAQRF